jgi:hypothetical protein
MVHGEAKKRLSVDTAPVNFSTTTTIELSILGEQAEISRVAGSLAGGPLDPDQCSPYPEPVFDLSPVPDLESDSWLCLLPDRELSSSRLPDPDCPESDRPESDCPESDRPDPPEPDPPEPDPPEPEDPVELLDRDDSFEPERSEPESA